MGPTPTWEISSERFLGGGEVLFDVIVAVVPYVPTSEMALLPHGSLTHGSTLSYDGGPDGADILRRVVARAPAHLRAGGALLLEVGGDQDRLLADDLRRFGFADPDLLFDEDGDLRGIEAVLDGWKGSGVRVVLAVGASGAVLAACGGHATTAKTTTTTRPPTTSSTAPPLTPPHTGLPQRNVARNSAPAVVVKIDNVDPARPQSGIDQADIVYEEMVEGADAPGSRLPTSASDRGRPPG